MWTREHGRKFDFTIGLERVTEEDGVEPSGKEVDGRTNADVDVDAEVEVADAGIVGAALSRFTVDSSSGTV